MLDSVDQHEETGYLASVSDVWKSYGGIPVLKGVSLNLRAGEIHALAGGNGAGKSTLMKVLTGVVTPDSGSVVINGKELRRLSPRSAHENGIYMVPQEPKLFPSLSVKENISLSLTGLNVPTSRIREFVKSLAPHINLNAPAGDLSISDQQLVEIVRGMLRDARVLIVDEPTSSLTAREVDSLFERLRALAADGVGIFYITHRMNEIFDLCNCVTVLRDGNMVFNSRVSDTSVAEVVQEMVPNAVQVAARTKGDKSFEVEIPTLKVDKLTGQGFNDISFEVYPGEIVGIAGVVGSGRTELVETVYGIRDGSGKVLLDGVDYSRRSPAASTGIGIAYVPEDRHANGVFLLGDIVHNTTSTILGSISASGFIKSKLEQDKVKDLTQRLALQQGSLSRAVGKLSGGNQQKVSLAKALASAPKTVILDEPSRGVDVGARADLYVLINELASSGTAVLVISSDFEEIVEVADRILVMRDGELKEELTGDRICLETVRDCCFDVTNGGQK